MLWDYHVILLLRPLSSDRDDMDDGENSHAGSLIYDFDTTLDSPCDARRRYLIHRLSVITLPGRVSIIIFSERTLINLHPPPPLFFSTRSPYRLSETNVSISCRPIKPRHSVSQVSIYVTWVPQVMSFFFSLSLSLITGVRPIRKSANL